MKTNGQFVGKVTVTDPDTKQPVEMEVYKLDGGGMVGIDSSFIEQELPVYSPFDKNVEIDPETFE
jgi:hypothetical protein